MLVAGMATAAATRAGAAIQDFEVRGNERIATETIRHHLALPAGMTFDAATANAALRRLYATGQFADVRIERSDARLIVTVVENPAIASISIEGRGAFDEKTIRAATGLRPAEPFTRAKADAARERLRDAYRGKGYADATIEVQIVSRSANRVDLTIVISEGTAAKIERIIFTGNRAIPERALHDAITTREAGVFDFLRATPPHDEKRLDADRELLMQHYRKAGYPDVRIEPAVSQRSTQTGNWIVTFAIDEGERYRLGDVSITSKVSAVDSERLRQHIKTNTGETWDAAALEASIERMTGALLDEGHQTSEVIARPSRDPVARKMSVEYVVQSAPKLVIERIAITGNAWTKDMVIRRELAFAEGDIYHPLIVQRARKRLKALGLFSKVDVSTAKGTERDRVVLNISVAEQDSREIGFGVGYSSTEGVTGDISFAERNLFGNGQYLKLLLAGSQTRTEAQLSFTEPYFLDRKLAAGFDLFWRDTDNILQSSYKNTRAGGTLRLGFDVAANTTAAVNYTFARNTIYGIGDTASAAIRQAVPGFPRATSARYDTSSIGNSLTYDTRDRASNPMQGVYLSTSQDLAGLGGDVRYLRSVSEAHGYYALTDRVTLAGRVTSGAIAGWGGSEVRLLDQFYRGGETIRGFATSGIGPRDTLSANKDALGGRNYLATTAELRFPLPFAPDSLGLRAAVFADAGSLWGVNKSTKATPGVVGTSAALRASTGASLIWDSPVGPLRVDYARPLAKQPFDKTQPLRFGLVPGF